MHPADWRLINGRWLEAIPAPLARGRGNAVARSLTGADWLIRRKSDGQFLALRNGDTVTELQRGALTPTLRADLLELADTDAQGERPRPLQELTPVLAMLQIDEDYAQRSGLQAVAEPGVLAYAGRDRYRRPLWLTFGAARGWRALHRAAQLDGVFLEAISGYRSHAYQTGIFHRKLARGLLLEDILSVNAAPGFSEHHSGNAIDIGTPGEPAAEESFEATEAFRWLARHGADCGFVMSYPRDNPHGIVYEPWHWYWHGGQDPA